VVLLSGEPDTNLMKITIEPSKLGRINNAPKVVVDSQNDEDSTADAMDILVGALVAAGHHKSNVDNWVLERAEMMNLVVGDDNGRSNQVAYNESSGLPWYAINEKQECEVVYPIQIDENRILMRNREGVEWFVLAAGLRSVFNNANDLARRALDSE